MPSTSPGSALTPWTKCAAGLSRTPGVIAGGGMIRCSASGVYCAVGPHHSQRSCARLLAGLEAGDHDQQVALAGSPPRTCARIYRCRDRAQAERHLLAWFTAVAETRDPRAGPTGPTHRRLAR